MGNETCTIGSLNQHDPILTCPQDSYNGLFDLVPAITAIVGPAIIKLFFDSAVNSVSSFFTVNLFPATHKASTIFNSAIAQKVQTPKLGWALPHPLPHKETNSYKYEILGFTLNKDGLDYLPPGWYCKWHYEGNMYATFVIHNENGDQVFEWSHYYSERRDRPVTFLNDWILAKLDYDWSEKKPYALVYQQDLAKSDNLFIHGFFPLLL